MYLGFVRWLARLFPRANSEVFVDYDLTDLVVIFLRVKSPHNPVVSYLGNGGPRLVPQAANSTQPNSGGSAWGAYRYVCTFFY